MKTLRTLVLLSSAIAALPAQAALHDRGGGLIYDDVLNVTWLQDANYAKTSGYSADGRITWSEALAWADSLTYFDSVRGRIWSDWRLPRIAPVGANWNYSGGYEGLSDYGFNVTSSKNELSYMYYVNLGLKGLYDVVGHLPPNSGVTSPTVISSDGVTVTNLQNWAYWTGIPYDPYPGITWWAFDTSIGLQSYGDQYSHLNVWAVRDGDVAAVPEPEAYALLIAGLGLLSAVSKRKSHSESRT